MINKANSIFAVSLVSILVLSALLFFGVDSPVLHILLAINYILIGVGILLSFFKMISSETD